MESGVSICSDKLDNDDKQILLKNISFEHADSPIIKFYLTEEEFYEKGFSTGLKPNPETTKSVLKDDEKTKQSSKLTDLLMNVNRDGRLRVNDTSNYPHCCIGKVVSQFNIGKKIGKKEGSGALIGPHHFLTAAHCVYDLETENWAIDIAISCGRNGILHPNGEIKVAQIYIHKIYRHWHNRDYDFAILLLEKTIGLKIGWLGCMFDADSSVFENKELTISGYPGDKGIGEEKGTQMWSALDIAKKIKCGTFKYFIDTAEGQSGAPIFMFGNYDFDETGLRPWPVVIGVHTHGIDKDDPSTRKKPSFGVRLDVKKFKFIKAVIDASTLLFDSNIKQSDSTPSPSYITTLTFQTDRSVAKDLRTAMTSLHRAAAHGDIDQLIALITLGAEVNQADPLYGETALHWAARYGHLAVVKILIENKANVMALSKLNGGLTPAGIATQTNHANVLKILIDAGAHLNTGCYGIPLLHGAAKQNSLEIAKLLLQCGAEINLHSQKTNSTALGCAALARNIEMVEFLVQMEANVNTRKGESQLLLAVKGGEHSIYLFDCAIIIFTFFLYGVQDDPAARQYARKIITKNHQAHYAFETIDFARNEAQKRKNPAFFEEHLKEQIAYFKRIIAAKKKLLK